MKWNWAIGYVLSIVLGNIFVSCFGMVSAFGLVFPAGAVWIGITFTLRDLAQREWGDRKIWYFMIFSTLVTALLGVGLSNLPIPTWKIAMASSVAFLASETVDWFVYRVTRLDITWRILISNFLSTPIDSILFVGLAFGSFSFFQPPVYGQTIIKYVSGLAVIPFLIYFRCKAFQDSGVEIK